MKHILFVVSEDRYFVSHRLHLAEAAILQGYKVTLLTKISDQEDLIESKGVEILNWSLKRSSYNPIKELVSVWQIFIALKRIKPDLVHAVALKPILYTSISSKISGLTCRVFSIAGLGFIFSSEKLLARILRPFIVLSFQLALTGKKTRLIVQNRDDMEELLRFKIINKEKINLIRGAGVNTKTYSPQAEKEGLPVVLLPARFLWDKGIGDFVQAARLLKESGVKARFVLVGEPDNHNPETIENSQIQKWINEEVIESWGYQEKMPDVYSSSAIVCLPSYREGLPKALLEAASSGRPIVTNDVPGCREVVIHEENGFLVTPQDSISLADALKVLINNKELRESMGKNGRKRIKQHFAQGIIAQKTSQVWKEVLD